MAHPPRFDENDPYLLRLRDICIAFPSAQEKISHGHPAFFTKKIFATFGAVVKGDHASTDHAQSVIVFPDADEREALLEIDRIFEPAYFGPYGWVAYDFRAGEVDWDEIAELVDASYRNTATKKLVKELDALAAPDSE